MQLKKKNTQHQSLKGAEFESDPEVKEGHEMSCTCILIFFCIASQCLFYQPKLYLYEPVLSILVLGKVRSGDRDGGNSTIQTIQ